MEEFTEAARVWLDEHAERRDEDGDDEFVWGKGDFDVSVFHALSHADEQALDRPATGAGRRPRPSSGYHAITASPDEGGLGLPNAYARDYARLERDYVRPPGHEVHSVTTRLIAPTIRVFGTPEQQAKFVPTFLAAGELCCQLFSEPGAGSDLATLACRAERDGDEWIVNGQKVWSSGAQFAQWGELIARTDPDVRQARRPHRVHRPARPARHDRPPDQADERRRRRSTRCSSTTCASPTRCASAPIGSGWKVALTTLGFERDHSGTSGGAAASVARGRSCSAPRGRWASPTTRSCASSSPAPTSQQRIEGFLNRRAADLRRAGQHAGPEGSLGKLLWTEGMRVMSDAVSAVLGAKLIADTGEWGTYEWHEHVLGAPGYRIAGGSDEMQRNIIGERVLGLPPEPRVDKDVAWRDVPR